MSDPAIEAAQRVVGERHWLNYGTDCAREALNPIRALHRPIVIQCLAPNCGAEMCDHEDDCPVDHPVTVCAKCWDIATQASRYYGEEGIGDEVLWPCDTAERACPTEELEP